MKKKDNTEKIIIYGMIILAVFAVYIMYTNILDKRSCVANPLIFSVKQYNEVAGVNLSCSCIFDDMKYNPFILNKTGIVYYADLINRAGKVNYTDLSLFNNITLFE